MVKYKEVYNALSYHEWRSALEVKGIIGDERRVEPRKLNVGSIYAHLGCLVDEELAQIRDRQLTEEQLKVRGERGQSEYKLTESGLRRRVEGSPSEGGYIEDALQPA